MSMENLDEILFRLTGLTTSQREMLCIEQNIARMRKAFFRLHGKRRNLKLWLIIRLYEKYLSAARKRLHKIEERTLVLKGYHNNGRVNRRKKATTFEIDKVNGIIRGTIDKETMDLVRERFPEWIEK